ncbi:VOC family protein [Pusillimonas sp. MFBS29]|nr:VOC family protein [Pusillimonas sp. MFBS29]MCC2596800.1 VOC family protein [Pusillimonas sp. MFBS29]
MSWKALFDLDPDDPDKIKVVPAGMSTVTPHMVCANASDAIDFYKRAFGAIEMGRMEGPDGKIAHAYLHIGNSAIFLVDENPQWGALGPQTLKGTPVSLHLYVPDADEAAKKAVAAGARLIMDVQDMFWGDRYGMLEDPFGHRWSVATHIQDLSPEEIKKASAVMMTEGGCGGDAPQSV